MSRKKDSRISYHAHFKDGLNWSPIESTEDAINITWRLLRIDCDKKVNAKEKSMPLSWKPEDLIWPAVDQESQFQDILYQKVLDRLNERVAAIFTGPRITASAQAWRIRSMDYGGPGYACGLGKELLIKLSEGPERTDTMNLYQVYIVDLKDHSIEEYGPTVAKNSAAAERRALAWLVADANDENVPLEIYDGDIEHYHFFAAKIASCIPDKITNE